MKRYGLLALAASLFTLAPGELKGNEFRVYVEPGYKQDRPYYYRHYGYYHDAGDYYGQRWHGYHHYYYGRD